MADRPVAALLLNWRRADLTLRCLRDLLAVAAPAMRVFVIDNGSGADEVAALRSGIAALPPGPHTVELLALPANTGFTGGMNAGFRAAAAVGAPFALVLNNDLELAPGFLQPLHAALVHDPSLAAVGPTVVHPDGTVWAQGGERACTPNGLRLRGHRGAAAPTTAGPEAVEFLPCACVLFRVSAVQAVGGFDDRYFMYWEDVDLCLRLRAAGHGMLWLPWVRVVHASGQSSGGGRSPLRKYLMACNHVRFLRAHGGVGDWLSWSLTELLAWPLTLASGPRTAWAKLCGMVAGLRGHAACANDVQRWLPARTAGK